MSLTDMIENGYKPIDNGIMLFNADQLQGKGESAYAIKKICDVYYNRPKSIVVEIGIYRKYIPLVLKYIEQQAAIRNAMIKEHSRFYNAKAEKSNKRWTPEEDEILIEQACQDESNMNQLSIIFGRTPSAIQARITYLVGRKRLSQEVAGKFIGYIDGKKQEADIVGTVYKDGKKGD